MQKRKLGNSDLEVSALGLGCMRMSFGDSPIGDKEEMIAFPARRGRPRHHLLRHGRSLWPLHQRRTGGRSAGAVSRAGGDRHQVRLQARPDKGPNPTVGLDSRPEQIKRVAEASLKRLRVEAIDLFYQHRPDPNVPIEDVAGAVKELIQAGKVKHFGLSEARRRHHPPRPRRAAGHGPAKRVFDLVAHH